MGGLRATSGRAARKATKMTVLYVEKDARALETRKGDGERRNDGLIDAGG